MEDDKHSKDKKRNGGAFQSMNLSPHVYKAIVRMGYKLPTPIQRKVIPFALDGRDVVAMARTGSGKTAAFMIPTVERLQAHSLTVGCRALIVSPARELAMQISSYARKLCKFTDLRVTLIVGGSSMENQFESLASNPDIIIATPGRLVHHMEEVKTFSLKAVQMLIFDEADRLFEMGFAEQLSQILQSAPPSRQVMLVSATMPTQLADFARAGLKNPAVIRLDAEHTLSDNLATWFCMTRPEEKLAALLKVIRKAQVLLDEAPNAPTIEDADDDAAAAAQAAGEIKSAAHYNKHKRAFSRNTGKRMRNVCVFACSKHHVEYVGQMLQQCGISASLVYGNMDQEARTKAVDDFRKGKVQVMVTTDLAARGIDLPILDTVVNFDFPTSAKLFVHRVGRTARAGRSGLAVSLMTLQDLPYVVDLLTFLGKKFVRSQQMIKSGIGALTPLGEMGDSLILGAVPVDHLDREKIEILNADADLASLKRSMEAAFKLYMKTRESASDNGVRRAKEIVSEFGGPMEIFTLPHPAFKDDADAGIHVGDHKVSEDTDDATRNEMKAEDWLATLRSFRPSQQKNSTKYQVLSTFESLNAKRAEQELLTKAAAGLAAMDDKERLKKIGLLKGAEDSEDDDSDSEWEDVTQRGQDDDEEMEDGSEDGDDSDEDSDDDEEGSDDDESDSDDEELSRQLQEAEASLKRKKAPASASAAPRKAAKTEEGPSAVSSLLQQLRQKADISQIFDAHRFRSATSFIDPHADPTKREQQRQLTLDTFNILGDDGKSMQKNKSVRKWDAKKKKYVIVNVDSQGRVIKEKQGNRKNEAGGKIDKDAKPGELYAKWEKQSHKRVGALGEVEDPSAAVGKNGRLRMAKNIVALGEDEPRTEQPSGGKSRAGLASRMKQHPLYKTSTYAGIVEAFENNWKLTHKQERKLHKLQQAVEATTTGNVKTASRTAKNELVTSATKLAANRKEAEEKKIKQSPRLRREASMKSRAKHMDKVQKKMDGRGSLKRSFAIVKGQKPANAGKGGKKGGKGKRR